MESETAYPYRHETTAQPDETPEGSYRTSDPAVRVLIWVLIVAIGLAALVVVALLVQGAIAILSDRSLIITALAVGWAAAVTWRVVQLERDHQGKTT